MISPSFQYRILARSPLAGRITSMTRGLSQNSRSSACASKMSGGGSSSMAGAGLADAVADEGAASVADAAALACAGCAAGLADATFTVCDAQPIIGTPSTPAADRPKPFCKNSLRDAIVYPLKQYGYYSR